MFELTVGRSALSGSLELGFYLPVFFIFIPLCTAAFFQSLKVVLTQREEYLTVCMS